MDHGGPLIFTWPILIFPNFLDVFKLFRISVHDGVSMFGANNDLVIRSFNIRRCAIAALE